PKETHVAVSAGCRVRALHAGGEDEIGDLDVFQPGDREGAAKRRLKFAGAGDAEDVVWRRGLTLRFVRVRWSLALRFVRLRRTARRGDTRFNNLPDALGRVGIGRLPA